MQKAVYEGVNVAYNALWATFSTLKLAYNAIFLCRAIFNAHLATLDLSADLCLKINTLKNAFCILNSAFDTFYPCNLAKIQALKRLFAF